MRTTEKRDKMLAVRNGWLVCPVCRRNKRLLHVLPETTAENLEVFCRDCKSTLKVDISIGQSVERRSQ